MPNLTVDPQPNPLISSEPIPVNPSLHNFSKSILIGILIFVLLSLTAYGAYWYGQSVMTENVSAPIPGANPDKPQKTSTPTATDEIENWKTYSDNNYKFTFKYPSNAKIEIATEEILSPKSPLHRVSTSYLGPNNKSQTEVADGYFFTVNLTEKQPSDNLRGLLAENVKSCLEGGDLRSLQTPTEFYAKSGTWRYSCQGLGIFVHNLMLDPTKDNFYYDLITHVTSPEETKETLYQKTVDQILSTFKFLPSTPPDAVSNEPANIGTYKGIPIKP